MALLCQERHLEGETRTHRTEDKRQCREVERDAQCLKCDQVLDCRFALVYNFPLFLITFVHYEFDKFLAAKLKYQLIFRILFLMAKKDGSLETTSLRI